MQKLLFTILLFSCYTTVISAQSVIIGNASGSCSALDNILFEENGTHNSKPRYQADNSSNLTYIRWTGTQWELFNTIAAEQQATNASTANTPPCTGWMGVNSCAGTTFSLGGDCDGTSLTTVSLNSSGMTNSKTHHLLLQSTQIGGKNQYKCTSCGTSTDELLVFWDNGQTRWEVENTSAAPGTALYSNTENSTLPPCSASSAWTDEVGFQALTVASSCETILPVELISFTGNIQHESIILNWKTATELNNKGFYIQRSKDSKNWENISFVYGYNTTHEVKNYTYTDELPLIGINYYRLQQVDFDGQFEYSDIVNIEYRISNDEVSIFPNPIRNELNIVNGEGMATIYNLLGQPMKQFAVNSGQFSINTTDLPKGQYLLSIQKENGNVVTRRFTK
jgi:hypothetical protein